MKKFFKGIGPNVIALGLVIFFATAYNQTFILKNNADTI